MNSQQSSRNIDNRILREISSGGVIYKKDKDKVQWLIVRSSPSKEYPHEVWRLPKGWIDDEEKGRLPGTYSRGEKRASEVLLQETALREVEEEAGVKAKIVSKIGTERFFFNSKLRGGKVLKFVTFYLMHYQKDTKDGFGFETAETKWQSFEKAYETLTHNGEKEVLKKAKNKLGAGLQEILL